MYSVQRRRTGCKTCRERKVKCDETRPGCSRCEKANFVCKGYDEDFVTLQRRHAPPRSGAPENYVHLVQQPPKDMAKVQKASKATFRRLDLTAFQDTIWLTYTLENLFRHKDLATHEQEHFASYCINWFTLALTSCQRDPSSQPAMRALCAAYFGKIHHETATMRRGILLYDKALKAVQQRLYDDSEVNSYETLRDAMLLGVYEMIMVTSPSAWMQHADGMARLFEYKGPYAFRDPAALHILESSRLLIVRPRTGNSLYHAVVDSRTPKIVKCLLLKKSCFLSEQEWLTVPWSCQETPKSFLVQLQDVMTFLPNLLEQATLLKSDTLSPWEKLSRAQEVLALANYCIRGLFEWRIKWEVANPREVREVPSNSEGSVEMKSPFDTVLYFECFNCAAGIMQYNAALLSLLLEGRGLSLPDLQLEGGLAEDESQLPLLFPSSRLTARGIAIEICRMVEYQFASTHRNAGTMNLVYPLSMAWLTLDGEPELRAYLSHVIDMIADHHSFEVSRTVTKYGRHPPPEEGQNTIKLGQEQK